MPSFRVPPLRGSLVCRVAEKLSVEQPRSSGRNIHGGQHGSGEFGLLRAGWEKVQGGANMNLWYSKDAEQIAGAHARLSGNSNAISGDCSGVWGRSFIGGDVTELRGCLTGLRGNCEDLSGEVSLLRGDISKIRGLVNSRLIGDVSGLCGDVTNVWGKVDRLRGAVGELLEQGLLWRTDQSLSLEMFASRHNLPMEFLDNSGHPALIAFHALEGVPLHWVTVRSDEAEGFTVGSLAAVSAHFPGQEIIKVAVPSDGDWQLLEGFELLSVDRIYAFEQSTSPVHEVLS